MTTKSKRTVLTLVASALALAPATALAADGRALYDKGAKLFESGDFEGAAKLFAEAYAAEPEPAYIFSEASAYRRLGNAEIASLRYEKYLSVLPTDEREDMRSKARGYASEMRLAIGLEFQARGDCRAGLVHLKKAVEHEAMNGAAWMALGECSEATGDRATAETAYAAAIRALAPGDAVAKSARAKLDALRSTSTADEESPAATTPPSSRPAKKKTTKTKGITLGIVLGVAGGVLLAGAVVTVVVLGTRGGSTVEFPMTDLGVMDWETGR